MNAPAAEPVTALLRPVGTMDRVILRRCSPCLDRGVITPHPLAMQPKLGGIWHRLRARVVTVLTGRYVSPYPVIDPTKCPICGAPSNAPEPLETLIIGAEK